MASDERALTEEDLIWTSLGDQDPNGNWTRMQLFEVRDALRTQGLHVVTAAQMAKLALIEDPLRLIAQLSDELEEKGLRIATRAERRVLEAMALVNEPLLENHAESPGPLGTACKAELARREGK